MCISDLRAEKGIKIEDNDEIKIILHNLLLVYELRQIHIACVWCNPGLNCSSFIKPSKYYHLILHVVKSRRKFFR
jgi:hypothetical protein